MQDYYLYHNLNIKCERSSFPQRFDCKECECRFFGFKNLHNHVFLQHSDKCETNIDPKSNVNLLTCEICAKVFRDKSAIVKHQQRRHLLNASNFTEKIPYMEIKKADDDEPDLRKPLTDVMFCRICEKIFFERNDHTKHMKADHPEEYRKAAAGGTHFKLTDFMGFTTLEEKVELESKVYASCHLCDGFFKIGDCQYKHSRAFKLHHQKHHQDQEEFKCEVCFLRFPCKLAMRKHDKVCENKVSCSECNRKFLTKASLLGHITKNHVPSRNFNESKTPVMIHERAKDEDGKLRYKCDICSAWFATNRTVINHKLVIHGINVGEDKEFKCEYCEYVTKSKINLKNHVQYKHKCKKHVCETCGKKFKMPKDLKDHLVRAHSNETHVCDVCAKVFNNIISLNKHQKTHDEAKYFCEECGKAFNQKNLLSNHKKCAHTEVRNHICGCGKAYKLRSHLIRHCKESKHELPRSKYLIKLEEKESAVKIDSEDTFP